ncbi:TRZ/ATZ family hydrolase [Nitrogeniibacter mangrovi]|uniref:5-methylthioadenosine/S-adenosylhomocysteine deaminase n=1 Tax=Nitrogeniibacter mangrovi TaxID=2016596 RepID=A0A6C1B592_9RHOO|nr:TRZ/ATZ family hydrolase [Nitrogeniibacter mangrovi]QID17384.1 TRZ/ATZ family hydrolase [Nitrogeniibacter mangrovi]
MSETAELLISARWVIPVEPGDPVLEHHSVAVQNGRIVAVLPRDEARLRFAGAKEHTLEQHALIPGLVNLHTHAAMSLMRGLADDLPLMQWLEQAIWPAEGKHVSAPFVRDGTLLAAAEMLRGGITTCNDMYFYPDAAAAAFDQIGMRAVVGVTTIEFPTPYASSADEYLRKGLAARDQWRGHPRIGFALAPHAPYTVTDDTFSRIVNLANELDLPIHLHVHETAHEVSEGVHQHGMRPLARLEKLGIVGANLIGVHAVHLADEEIAMLAHYGASVAHCPSSNMKLASGIAPITALTARGVRVGLGTDGAASNNRLDLFTEMREAALLAKVSSGDASALPAARVLRMATMDGATALGMADSIGSISPGKYADLCAVDLSTIETQPCFNPVSHLVYCAGREHVTDVWVGGEAVLKHKQLLQKPNSELLAIARVWQNKLGN